MGTWPPCRGSDQLPPVLLLVLAMVPQARVGLAWALLSKGCEPGALEPEIADDDHCGGRLSALLPRGSGQIAADTCFVLMGGALPLLGEADRMPAEPHAEDCTGVKGVYGRPDGAEECGSTKRGMGSLGLVGGGGDAPRFAPMMRDGS